MATSEATRHYEEGDIGAAIAAAIRQVKSKPADTGARGFLCELLCFDGDIGRVDKHLDVLVEQQPDLTPGLSLFRQIMRGEAARREVFDEGRIPEFIGEPPEHLTLTLKAIAALRAGDNAGAMEMIGEAAEKRPAVSGTVNGKPFSEWRDLDDLTAGHLEVITAKGSYYWVPFERIQHLAFDKPKRARDLIWRQATIDMSDGPDAVVYVPVLYAGTERAGDDALRLGRATEWSEDESVPVRGLGQRTYLFDEDDLTIMELGEIVPAVGPGAAAS